MKKQFYAIGSLFIVSLILFSTAFAQSGYTTRFQKRGKSEIKNLRKLIAEQSAYVANSSISPGNSTTAFGEVRFAFDPSEETGSFQIVGVCYLKGYFYFTKFSAADTLIIFDSTGNFVEKAVVPNINRVRSLTTDGTFLYGASGSGATGAISRFVSVINPVTKTRVRQFQVPANVGAIRWITYNPEGAGGAGSFFCGDYGTAIFQINKPTGATATLINSIPAATHGQEAMYGVAYEANGANSVFWVNDQGTTSQDEANVTQLNAAGVPTGITIAAHEDAPSGVGTSGGISVASVSGYPGNTLLAYVQGGGLVAYDIAPSQVEVAVDSFYVKSGLAAWPGKAHSNQQFVSQFKSFGQAPISNLIPKIEVRNAATEALIETINLSPLNLNFGQSAMAQTAFGSAPYANGTTYSANAIVSAPGDEITDNDTLAGLFGITDTTYARSYSFLLDNFVTLGDGIYGPADGEKALGVKFKIDGTDTLTSVSYYLDLPYEGQPSSVSVYSVTNGVISTTPLATSAEYVATAEDETDGVLVTLPLPSPLPLTGEFLISVNELGDSAVFLGAFPLNYSQGTSYNKFSGAPSNGLWYDVHNYNPAFGFRNAYSIYPNFGKTVVSSTKDQIAFKGININPNPSTGKVNIFMEVPNNQQFGLIVVNSIGKKIEVPSTVKFNNRNLELDFKNQEPGVYFISLTSGNSKKTLPLVITK
jgi:hypothetical protein